MPPLKPTVKRSPDYAQFLRGHQGARPRCRDGADPPTLSPGLTDGSGVLDLYPRWGDLKLHFRCQDCDVKWFIYEGGTGAGGTADEDGCCTVSQDAWGEIPVVSIADDHLVVRLITNFGGAMVEFWFETNDPALTPTQNKKQYQP